MKGARGVIINVTGGMDMTLYEADEACNRVREEVDANANIIFGSTFDESLEGRMRVSVVATGIDSTQSSRIIGGGKKGLTGVNRAQPMTTSGEESAASTSAPITTAQATVSESLVNETPQAVQQQAAQAPTGHVPASRPTYNPAAVTASQQQADIFDQTAPSQNTSRINTASSLSADNGVPRAERMGGSFIPPMPMYIPQEEMPENMATQSQVQMQQAQQQPQTQPQYVAASEPVQGDSGFGPKLDDVQSDAVHSDMMNASSGSSLTLRPPVPAAHKHVAATKKRSPSLFERITGVLRDSDAEIIGMDDGAAPKNPAKQGQLNIDSPSAPAAKNPEDELDIPAFLRRQAN
jgi:cell division protein FtsZ